MCSSCKLLYGQENEISTVDHYQTKECMDKNLTFEKSAVSGLQNHCLFNNGNVFFKI